MGEHDTRLRKAGALGSQSPVDAVIGGDVTTKHRRWFGAGQFWTLLPTDATHP